MKCFSLSTFLGLQGKNKRGKRIMCANLESAKP